MGLPGFPNATEFVVLDHRPGSIFRWLQAANEPTLAFVVIDPVDFVPDYPVATVRKHAAFAGITADEEMAVLAICTVRAAPAPPTANFLAPIGIGRTSRVGAQVVLHESGLGSTETFLNRNAPTE